MKVPRLHACHDCPHACPLARPRLTRRATGATSRVCAPSRCSWSSPTTSSTARGGFLGVDVFFVLSGFLITGLLVREHQREGGIGYADFYRRRVDGSSRWPRSSWSSPSLATFALYSAERGREVALDAGWAFGFLANWRFAEVGTDYFTAGGPISPLQHYWSLSVEEQFYFVWPTLILACLWIVGRRGRSGRMGRLALLTVTLLFIVVSFMYSV